MKFVIHHVTTYSYNAPVHLNHHTLRFRPRSDGAQEPRRFKLQVQPKPSMRTEFLNPEGNTITKVWFEGETTLLSIDVQMEVETLRQNPFDYYIDSPSVTLPMHYEEGLDARLLPYLSRGEARPEVDRFAKEIAGEAEGQTSAFLLKLAQRMYRDFERESHDSGEPLPPLETLQRRRGAACDLTVLFMDACRAMGLAARFVSGYQHKSEPARDKLQLHVWPEVYLPGGGWRGYDPTHGSAVADKHVALAAGALPASAALIEGTSTPAEVDWQVREELQIQVSESGES